MCPFIGPPVLAGQEDANYGEVMADGVRFKVNPELLTEAPEPEAPAGAPVGAPVGGQVTGFQSKLPKHWNADGWEDGSGDAHLSHTAAHAIAKGAASGVLVGVGSAPPEVDRSARYFSDNLKGSGLLWEPEGARNLVFHPLAGGFFGFLPAYQKLKANGATEAQAKVVGFAAAAAVGVGIELAQMTEGDSATGLGTHPGSSGDAFISTAVGGAAVGAVLAGVHESAESKYRETGNPVYRVASYLTDSEKFIVLPHATPLGKVDGVNVVFHFKF